MHKTLHNTLLGMRVLLSFGIAVLFEALMPIYGRASWWAERGPHLLCDREHSS